MDKVIFDKFYDKFNVAVRKGRGGNYSYVTANDVTDRMNKLFLGNWCSEVMSQDVDATGAVIIRVKVSILDPESKMWFHHEGFGGHKDVGGEPGSSFKSAYSKALVNACRRWGVGLYLDEEAPSSAATQKVAPKPIQGPKPMTALPTEGLPPAPSKPAGPPMMEKPPVTMQTTVRQVTSPPAVVTPSIPKTPEPLEPVENISRIPEHIHGAPLNGGSPTAFKATTKTPPVVITTTVETPGVDAISDVQKIAIQSMYDMRGYKYEDLAQAVLGSVPDVNTLTHDQAVSVIQYGNDLYKKDKSN